MSSDSLEEQSAILERSLPELMRLLFALEEKHQVGDLPLAQLRVCTLLHIQPLSMSELVSELGVSSSSVSQMAERLEAAGLVERRGVYDDRRVRKLWLSDRGVEMMDAWRAYRRCRVALILGSFTPDERSEILRMINALKESARQCPSTSFAWKAQ